eukprot:213288_1
MTSKLTLSEHLHNWFLISIPSIAFFGCQLSWALQNGFVTPTLQELGVQPKHLTYVWLAGPISGIIVQPIIGVLSDQMTAKQIAIHGGKRRPFILVGCVCIVLCLLMFSNAKNVALYFNLPDYALLFAIVSFWLLDISVNIVQAPLRALLTDIIPSEYHGTANALFGIERGFGAGIGYFLGFLLSYNPRFGGGISVLFAIASVLVIIGCTITYKYSEGEHLITNITWKSKTPLLKMHKTSTISPEAAETRTEHNGLYQIWIGISNLPTPITRAFIVKFWSYCGAFTQSVYIADWFGKSIMNGNPDGCKPQFYNQESCNAYHKGVKYANVGFTLMALSSLVVSMVLPSFIRRFGYRTVYCAVLFEFGLVFVALGMCSNVIVAIVLISCNGVAFSAAQIVGWGIVTETLSLIKSKKKGLYTTIFNVANCLPQIFIALIAYPIISYFDHDLSSILFTAAISCFIGAICSLFIIEPKEWFHKAT